MYLWYIDSYDHWLETSQVAPWYPVILPNFNYFQFPRRPNKNKHFWYVRKKALFAHILHFSMNVRCVMP